MMRPIPGRLLRYLIFSGILLPFLSGCAVSNLAECGSLNCKKDTDQSYLYLAGLFDNSYHCSTPPASTASSLNKASLYESGSFTGRITNEEWDEAAVRRVLHTFLYGGPATDKAIKRWAGMDPGRAIVEMLNMDPVNVAMTPAYHGSSGPITSNTASLKCASGYLTSSVSPLEPDERSDYEIDSWNGPERVWYFLAMSRGSNPFRQKLGIWETNYHMSVNQSIVPGVPLVDYYDRILDDIASGLPYQTVLANAALSAAVAIQYNHRENRFTDGRFYGNEDFAREFHQLFFGILGTGLDPTDVSQDSNDEFENHEQVTIPNTGKALTDMTVTEDANGEYTEKVVFGTNNHYHGSLSILNTEIQGATAREKIRAAANVAIKHQESLATLPLKIVRGMADDNLVDTDDSDVTAKIATVQSIWQSMDEKNILVFLRRYAISTAFHNASRYKYRDSLDRHMTAVNLLVENAGDVSGGFYQPIWNVRDESVELFRPMHDVFGGQTSNEAAETPDIFLNQYNLATNEYYTYGVAQDYNGNNLVWEKDFASIIPPGENGEYVVKDVAEWLWNRFVGDSLANFGKLERAHVYALLVSGTDLPYYLADDTSNPDINTTVYTVEDIESDSVLNNIIFTDAPQQVIHLTNSDSEIRSEAKERISMAISFILATPYVFVQEGL